MRILIVSVLILCSLKTFAQQGPLTIEQAIDQALKNNLQLKAMRYEVESQRQLKKTSFDLPKTDVTLLYGQYNGYANDNNLTVSQAIPFTALGSQGALNRSLLASAELKKASSENELVYQVKRVYYQLVFVYSRHKLLLEEDSIFAGFLKTSSSKVTRT
jgi:cobalt-zinc-cadmium resistance protein CzcA